MWLGSMFGLFYTMPFYDYILPDRPFISVLGILNVVVLIGIPILSMILLIVRLVFGMRISKYWRTGKWIFYSLNIASLFFIGTLILREFSIGNTLDDRNTLVIENTQPLQLELKEDPYRHALFQFGPRLKFTEEALISKYISLEILKSPDSTYFVEKVLFSRGRTMREARELAARIEYPLMVEGQRLEIPSSFLIEEGDKFRGQNVKLKIYIPEGKHIVFGESLEPFAWHIFWERYIPFWENYNERFTMTADGLKCLECTTKEDKPIPEEELETIPMDEIDSTGQIVEPVIEEDSI